MMRKNEENPMHPREIPQVILDPIVKAALQEDLISGDATTEACIDEGVKAVGNAQARHDLVACGASVAATVFAYIDETLHFEVFIPDGSIVKPGETLWRVSGNARSILMGERVALNFVQRMSGIATLTRSYVNAIPQGCKTRIVDTRKTMPGLRPLDRYSVAMGGGFNNRDNLGSALFIKDNHISVCGGVSQAIQKAKKFGSHAYKIICEVDTLEQLDEALSSGIDIVLLDNMDTPTVIKAVQKAKGKALIEASGNMSIERVAELAQAGVDLISVGALTHSVKAADIGLDFN